MEGAQTFAVRASREGQHTFTSRDLERELGKVIAQEAKLKVDLSKPERTVYVEVREEEAYICTQRFPGPGGLPLGTAGRVLCLVSGGIDSPVAAWMMKRGCSTAVLFAHFPRGGDESDLNRFINVVKALREWSIGEPFPVYIYRHENNLLTFRKYAERYTYILCRRMMYRVANVLAERIGALGIVTGQNLTQVASQTLPNLRAIDEASELSVLRPLVGLDKLEIEALVRRIGTYDKSIQPVTTGCRSEEGCWARPRKPPTRTDLETIRKVEKEVEINKLLDQSVGSLKEITGLVGSA